MQRFYGNIKIDYNFKFLPELSAVLNVGFDKQNADGTVRVSDKNPLSQNDGSIVGSSSEYSNAQNNTLIDGYLSYKKDWNKVTLDGTAGYSYQKFTNKRYVSGELLDDGPDSEPINTFLSPVVVVQPALLPTIVLAIPVVIAVPVECPIAVLQQVVVIFPKAL